MSATLGGLIKDYRLQKNISQLEISFALGWREPSRLSRIEQGKVSNPPRKLIENLCIVMKLEEEEKNQLLLAGNYLPDAREIAEVKNQVEPILHNWPYPAVLIDFSWRIVDENEICKKTFFLEGKVRRHEYVLENLFDLNFPQNKYLRGDELIKWHDNLVRIIAQYQYTQKTRTKENWYIKLVKKMMGNALFKEAWQKALLTRNIDVLSNFGYKSVISTNDNSKRINYYYFVMPVIKDPRFQVELYMPV